MKHHKKQYDLSSKTSRMLRVFGDATSMIGKDILTLTFNADVALQLDFRHNESLSYEILIIN